MPNEQQIIAAIKRFDELRANGVLFRAAKKQVLAETGVDLRKMNFTPYRMKME